MKNFLKTLFKSLFSGHFWAKFGQIQANLDLLQQSAFSSVSPTNPFKRKNHF